VTSHARLLKMHPDHAGQPGEPPVDSLLSHGYQYLTEQREDLMEPALEIIRRDVIKLGLPLRSIEAHARSVSRPPT
jgi:glutamine synthetase